MVVCSGQQRHASPIMVSGLVWGGRSGGPGSGQGRVGGLPGCRWQRGGGVAEGVAGLGRGGGGSRGVETEGGEGVVVCPWASCGVRSGGAGHRKNERAKELDAEGARQSR